MVEYVVSTDTVNSVGKMPFFYLMEGLGIWYYRAAYKGVCNCGERVFS
jgi:hypothetical protein